jgi:ATP-dependent DNA helicase RecQ
LLRYFGEQMESQNCGGCDNCLTPREMFDGTIAAQKMLSCVYRVREKAGFDFGANHLVQVLTGAKTEAILKWGHDGLTTYAVGAEYSRAEWFHIARELIRLGHLEEVEGRFTTIRLTDEGLAVLKQRKPIELAKPAKVLARDSRARQVIRDEALLGRLTGLRKKLADERGLPPHVVLPDIALREMAARSPRSKEQLGGMTGFSEKKLQDFGEAFLSEVRAHVREKPMALTSRSVSKTRADDSEPYDEALFAKLREVRRKIADERGVPAFVILHDSALREIARRLPRSEADLAAVRNVGQKRAADLGEAILNAVRRHQSVC